MTKRTQSRGNRTLTDRQRKFLELKTDGRYLSSAKAARLAGYSESVARKADHLITNSPAICSLCEEWLQQEVMKRRREQELREETRGAGVLNRVLRRLRS